MNENTAVELNDQNAQTMGVMRAENAEDNFAKNYEVEETPEETSQVAEKDGEIYLATESDNEEPQVDPDSGQTQEDTSDLSDFDEPDMYRGKSRNDIISMHQNASDKISDQGNELGQLRQTFANSEVDEKVLFENLTSKDIKEGIEVETEKLKNMDSYDPEYSGQENMIRGMTQDLSVKVAEETVTRKLNDSANQTFVANHQRTLESQGIKLSDGDYTDLTEVATNYSSNGIMNEASYQKALIDKYGVDMLVRNYSIEGEKKARTDIANASDKMVERVNVKGSGKNAKFIRLNDLQGPELQKAIKNLSDSDLNRLSDKM